MSSNGRACESCTYAEVVLADDDVVMECRRFPPISVPAPTLLPPPADAPELVAEYERLSALEIEAEIHRFPHVQSGDWCGEHEPEEQTT